MAIEVMYTMSWHHFAHKLTQICFPQRKRFEVNGTMKLPVYLSAIDLIYKNLIQQNATISRDL